MTALRREVRALSDAYALVCTNLTDETLVDWLNHRYPSPRGLWRVAEEPLPFDETENSVPCPDGLLGCRHVLFTSDDGDRWRASRRGGVSVPPGSFSDG